MQKKYFDNFAILLNYQLRIEAYGGSGGQLPYQTINNHGGRVVTVVNLTTAMELEILIGQMGESPCYHSYGKIKKEKFVSILFSHQ